MVTKIRTIVLCALMAAAFVPAFGQSPQGTVKLRIGSVQVDPADITSAACIQVPIFINDPDQANRDFLQVSWSVQLSGDEALVDGGFGSDVIVANAFTNSTTGLTNPGTDLTDTGGGGNTPSCGLIFNQATEGGAAVDFESGNANATIFTNNATDGVVARKSATFVSFTGSILVDGPQNTDIMVGVLEIPIVANPAVGRITVQASDLVDGGLIDPNLYQFDDGTAGRRVPQSRRFDVTEAIGHIDIFSAVDCSGASVVDANATAGARPTLRGGAVGINFLDPQAGGNGGALDFTFDHAATVTDIRVQGSDGYDNTFSATGTQSTLSINTATDNSPQAASNVTYTVTYGVFFAPAGEPIFGGSCSVGTEWNAPTVTVAADSQPVQGGNTNIDVTMSNVVYDAGNSRFAQMTSTAPGFTGPVNLNAPTSTSGVTLTYDDPYSITGIDADDLGLYTVMVTGPNGQSATDSFQLVTDPPENLVNCATVPQATIGGTVTIPLAGNNVTGWEVVYNGVTQNLPADATQVVLDPIVGTATTVTITAQGFDSSGNPDTDVETCTLDFVAPACGATTQNPDSTATPVDVGTVITLTLVSEGAITATIGGTAMTQGATVGDETTWTATHTALRDETITAVITNPDGETAECTWVIDINCAPPEMVDVSGEPGTVGTITILGTPGCTYTVTVSDLNGNVIDTIDIDIPDCGEDLCEGTASYLIPADAVFGVGQQGQDPAGGTIRTVPTLGEWGMIAFITLLMASGLVYMRKRRMA
ncbi:hypothetical protein SCOR_14085 [Sulfidibacter corallicola]